MGQTSVEAASYLSSFLNRTLHIHINDGRMFVGQMKCTDQERNIILAMTHEYRRPSEVDVRVSAEKRGGTGGVDSINAWLPKRFVGLVVVPGRVIEKIEVEN